MNRLIKIIIVSILTVPFFIKAHQVPFTFSANLYTESPIKKVNSLVMKLWSYVNASLVHEEQYKKLVRTQKQFTQEVLMLNSLLDNVLVTLQEESFNHPESLQNAAHDLEHCLKVLGFLLDQYQEVMEHHDTVDVVVTRYLLHTIIEKIEEVVKTGHVVTPLHAFVTNETVKSVLIS